MVDNAEYPIIIDSLTGHVSSLLCQMVNITTNIGTVQSPTSDYDYFYTPTTTGSTFSPSISQQQHVTPERYSAQIGIRI